MKALVAVLLACSFLVVVGFVSMQPEPASLGPMKLGDRWTYEDDAGTAYTFHWSGREYVTNEEGVREYANKLMLHGPLDYTYHFASDSLEPLRQKLSFLNVRGEFPQYESHTDVTYWAKAASCVLGHETIPETLEFSSCSPLFSEPASLTRDGWNLHGPYLDGSMEFQFQPGIPYPTKMSATYTINEEQATKTFSLVGFEPGTRPLQTEPLPEIGGFAHDLAPRRPWGPHMEPSSEFTLRTAYESAVADGYLPEGVPLLGAETYASTYGSQTRHSWKLYLDNLMLTVEKRGSQAQGILLPPTDSLHYHWQEHDRPVAPLPDQMPTKESLLREYRHFGGSANSPLVGFQFTPEGLETFAGSHDSHIAHHAEDYLFTTNEESTSYLRNGERRWMRETEATEHFDLQPAKTITSYQAPETLQPYHIGAGALGIAVGLHLLALFSRKLRPHPFREQLEEIIHQHPGIHFQAIRKALQLATGTAQHHLDKLVAEERVHTIRMGRKKCYFPPGMGVLEKQQAATLFQDETRQVYEAITNQNSIIELVAKTGLPRNTVTRHVQALVQCDLVASQRMGRRLSISKATS